jgi:hypothetical protein
MAKRNYYRKDKPHPVDLKEYKKPLLELAQKEERSIPYYVRQAVKEWLEKYYPEKLTLKDGIQIKS